MTYRAEIRIDYKKVGLSKRIEGTVNTCNSAIHYALSQISRDDAVSKLYERYFPIWVATALPEEAILHSNLDTLQSRFEDSVEVFEYE